MVLMIGIAANVGTKNNDFLWQLFVILFVPSQGFWLYSILYSTSNNLFHLGNQ